MPNLHNPKSLFHSSGFSLIEIMVSVTIVAILTSVSIGALTSIQRNNRDTVRKTDLRNIQSALQQYYADQLFYPNLPTNGLTAGSPLTSCLGNPTNCTNEKTYLNRLPTDPATNTGYYYLPLPSGCTNQTVDNRCYSFCLYTNLENNPTPTAIGSCTTFPDQNDYVVTQP